jgi:16S rRNA (uracil1498-N3)-methyltransferase
MSPPVFLAATAALEGDRVVLDGPEGRHAATVKRLRPGERADLTDGAGLMAECVVAAADRATLTLDVIARHRDPAPQPRLVVVQALPKGDRGELAVETMTEAGVDEIVPWAAARCVTQWRPERRDKALGRWRGAAREAAKQARRSRLPDVPDLAATPQICRRITEAVASGGAGYVLHEAARSPLSALRPPGTGEIIAVIGPEGGITDDELAAFTTAGAHPVRLGPTVLRTSTAGVATAAVLQAATGRW